MRDFTLNEEEKKNYILNIDFIDNNIVVKYADGHRTDGGPATDHNYNFYLNRMEQQYNHFKDEYKYRVSVLYIKTSLKIIANIIGQLLGIFLLYNTDINIVTKIISGIIFILMTSCYNLYQKMNFTEYQKDICHMIAVDYYLDNKEKFVIKTVNPNNGEEETLYIVDMNNIDAFNSEKSMEEFKDEILKKELIKEK